MKTTYDLSNLSWSLTGHAPFSWRFGKSMETGIDLRAEAGPVPAKLPGSVQRALLDAGLIPDWNAGLDARACEWVENRDWIFSAVMPDEWTGAGAAFIVNCEGLDGPGSLYINGTPTGEFDNAFIPHRFDITPHLKRSGNRIAFLFTPPPRWLGQIGYTSRITEMKPRFNYSWDWVSRLVQIGVWDSATLEVVTGGTIAGVEVRTETDSAACRGRVRARARFTDAGGLTVIAALELDGTAVVRVEHSPAELQAGITFDADDIGLWMPNGAGGRTVYTFRLVLVDQQGNVHDQAVRHVGFRTVEWRPCEGAPAGADPWICAVNGVPVFQRGVNWTPVRPNFADVPFEEVAKRIRLYADLGMNTLRVWGGAVLPGDDFYDACDQAGLMVWQEFPLSSSGLDNYAPDQPEAVATFTAVAETYSARRGHHPSLIMWTGGNELTGRPEEDPEGIQRPLDTDHPLLASFDALVSRRDPGRRFVPTSPSGPRFGASEEDFGKGLHWDVHGPWNLADGGLEAHRRYFAADDSLFRSETGAPGASPAEIIRRFSGGLSVTPGTRDNPLWARSGWWISWPEFVKEMEREPGSLEEYVEWSQERQAEALVIAARACLKRFPRCGGFIVWIGQDSFPCTENTAIVDFDGKPKKAALRLGELFRGVTERGDEV